METSVKDRAMIEKKFHDAIILFTFEVEWDGWEMDTTAWIIKPVDKDAILVMTNHGELFEESPSILDEQIAFYQDELMDMKNDLNTKYFTSLINQTNEAKRVLVQSKTENPGVIQ